MDNQLFRKKSIDHISSPEELHDYMRVTSPRLWMILSAIIVLLAGFIVYASTATMENTVPIRVTAESIEPYAEAGGMTAARPDTIYYSSLPVTMKDIVMTGMTVRIGTALGKISLISIADDENGENGTVGLIITMNNPHYSLPDGEYDAELVLESTTPISFLWN